MNITGTVIVILTGLDGASGFASRMKTATSTVGIANRSRSLNVTLWTDMKRGHDVAATAADPPYVTHGLVMNWSSIIRHTAIIIGAAFVASAVVYLAVMFVLFEL